MPNLMAPWWPPSSGFTSEFWAGRGRDRVTSSPRKEQIVVFSDPDTLRDESGPGWAATRAAVNALEDHGIAVVLWGNETRSEMELVQSDLNLHHPFISENGGGLFVRHGYFHDQPVGGRVAPHYDVVDFGKPYCAVAEALHEIARKVGVDVSGFSDMSIRDVAQDCGLSLAQARLAKLREYNEPFRLLDSEPAAYSRICSALRRHGLRCFPHESFHHATGVADKTHSLRMLASLYRREYKGRVLTVGLAREPSEICLLQAVDIPVVVQSEAVDTTRLGRKVPTARFTGGSGPQGWCDTVLQLADGQPGGP